MDNLFTRPLRPQPGKFFRTKKNWQVLEIGAGNLPTEGVTHIVDAYPDSALHRGYGSLEEIYIPAGVEFREGFFEKLPFPENTKFDFVYAQHVFEHVTDPVAAIRELNRVALAGYMETPSPLYEMLGCSYPYNSHDIHTLFVWNGRKANTICIIRKNQNTIQSFCNCKQGQRVKRVTMAKRAHEKVEDSFFTSHAKTTRFWFQGRVQLVEYANFLEACMAGECGFRSMKDAKKWATPPLVWFRRKSNGLRKLL